MKDFGFGRSITPMLRAFTSPWLAGLLAAAALLGGCATPSTFDTAQHLDPLLPADAILLGEQHDAPDHQRVHRDVVRSLAARGQLAALALEMAEQGVSTAGLPRDASEAQVRTALHWDDRSWPWRAYGPAVMAAVQAGVPVLGANLPRHALRASMRDTTLDALLPAPALQAQQDAIRAGHCDLLPESQILPMTRVQIARDRAMAQTVRAAARPGQTVLLLAGRGHVDRTLGIPRHLPADFVLQAVAIGTLDTPRAASAPNPNVGFDVSWPAAPGPDVDHCAQLAARRDPKPPR